MRKYCIQGGIVIKKTLNKKQSEKHEILSIEKIVNDCEKYRSKLLNTCLVYFRNEPDMAEDCVQEAYLALLENLKKGVVIYNYEGWLIKVALRRKDKVIRDKLKRKEYEFESCEKKDNVIESSLVYNPDFNDAIITDEMVLKTAIQIISMLEEKDRYIYCEHYIKHRKLVEIAKDLSMSEGALWKRNERIKHKLKKHIKNYNYFWSGF